MNFNEYQKLALRTALNTSLINGVMGLCGEAGEVIELVKKHEFQNKSLDKEKLLEELGDCLWYISLIANSLDTKLENVAIKNIEKLEKRYILNN